MNNSTTIPVYKRLLEDIKVQIHNGEYQIGDLLPSENELCKLYGITRPTVRHALSELTSLGYINRIHGKGSIVIEPKNGLGILSVKGVTAGVGRKNLTSHILGKPQKDKWPSQFYYELSKQELAAGCIFFSRLRFVNQLPVIYEETHIVNNQLPRFTTRNLENKSLFKTLKDFYQIEIIGGEQRIRAVNVDKNLRELLRIKTNSPVAHLERKLKTNNKDINLYSSLYCNTKEFFLQDYF